MKGLKERFEQIKPVADIEMRDGKWMIEQGEAWDFIAAEINRALDAVSLKQEQKKSFCGGKNECKRQTTTACQHQTEGWNFAVAELETKKANYRKENGL